jgi:hypothetical protein
MIRIFMLNGGLLPVVALGNAGCVPSAAEKTADGEAARRGGQTTGQEAVRENESDGAEASPSRSDSPEACLNRGLRPDSAVAYHRRGQAWERKGEKSKAEADFAQASKLGFAPP